MPHEDRHRAESFGDDAEQYDRTRPSYPAELLDELVGPDVCRVLDVGCGTGIAARLFAARGCVVLGIEPDARMAAVARRHGIDVVVSSFEAWDPPAERFDLVISGQAWHWVDPAIGPAKAAAVLRPGARLAAFWNSYAHAPEDRAAFDEAYRRHAPDLVAGSVITGTFSWNDEVYVAPLQASGRFEAIEQRRYPWSRAYRRDEWLDQLPTHSDHRTMNPETLKALLTDLGAAMDALGGQIVVDHTTRLIAATRRP